MYVILSEVVIGAPEGFMLPSAWMVIVPPVQVASTGLKLKAIKIAIKRREIVNPKAIFLANFSLQNFAFF
jgi:hypothetical protein